MRYMQRVVLAGLLFMPGMYLLAQLSASEQPAGQDQDKGFSSYLEFQGSSNSLGQVMSLDPSVSYNFNEHFGAALGLPFYFVHTSASTSSGGSTSDTGLGNLHVDLHLKFKAPIVNYTSVLTGMRQQAMPGRVSAPGEPPLTGITILTTRSATSPRL